MKIELTQKDLFEMLEKRLGIEIDEIRIKVEIGELKIQDFI